MSLQFNPDVQVIARIEHLIQQVVLSSSKKNDPLVLSLLRSQASKASKVSFPSPNLTSSKALARVLYILKCAHVALTSDSVVTKRNIYYEMPTLFTSQQQVNDVIILVSRTLQVNSNDLGIVAAGKGLAAGALSIHTTSGSTIDFSQNKKATFRSLVSDGFWETASIAPGILVTGKGYPDMATRYFLRWLHSVRPDLPMLAVTDFDPDGAKIFSCYKHGSESSSHEINSTIPSLEWLGVRSRHLQAAVRFDQHNNLPPSSPALQDQLLPMSMRDRVYAAYMMTRLALKFEANTQTLELMSQLQIMMMLGVKAEMQMFNENGNIAQWLDRQLVDYFWEIDSSS
ncbi:hypothetical protein BROUX41_003988 [Berkeleyomyces rouxiae]|uniref:uncharacterized protein n=1 Tax=Berkeleyomyces rouxiae TaxID=2035830 RepID=UPI003B7C5E0C